MQPRRDGHEQSAPNGKRTSPTLGENSERVQNLGSEVIDNLFGPIDEPVPAWPAGRRIKGTPPTVGDSEVPQVSITSRYFADVDEPKVEPYNEIGREEQPQGYFEEDSGQY